MENKSKLKSILLIVIPFVIVVVAIICVTLLALNKNDNKDIGIELLVEKEVYSIGSAKVEEWVIDPTYRQYTFESSDEKKEFLNKFLESVDSFDVESSTGKLHLWAYENKLFSIEDIYDTSKFVFSYSHTAVAFNDDQYITLPLVSSLDKVVDNAFSNGVTSCIKYEEFIGVTAIEKFKDFESFKGFYENANKILDVAIISEIEETIILKAKLFDIDGNFLGYKKMQLSFDSDGIEIKYNGEEW